MNRFSLRQLVLTTSILLIGLYLVTAAITGHLFTSPLSPANLPVPSGVLDRLRAVLGLLLTISFPGLIIALLIPKDRPDEPVDLFLLAFGFSAMAHILNLTFLKVAGLEPVPALFLLLGSVEILIFRILFARRRRIPDPELHAPPPSFWWGVGLCTLMVLGLVFTHQGYIIRELGDYWYDAGVQEGDLEAAGSSLEAAGISIERGDGWEAVAAFEYTIFRKKEVSAQETITFRAQTPTPLTLRYLWQGPVDSRVTIDCEDARHTAQVERAPVEREDEGPTLRYLDRGIVMVSLPVMVRTERKCLVRPDLLPGEHGTLVDVTGTPSEAFYATAAFGGWTLSHYYQILNIAENVEWARQLLQDRWVTLHQPPFWSYVYSSVVVYVGSGLWAINLFFFLMIGLTVLVAAEVVRLEHEAFPPWFWLPLILTGISHTRIIIASGSTNFPDNLYAFGAVAVLYALLWGEAVTFALSGAATTLLRYSGSGLVVLSAGLGAWIYKSRRRQMIRIGLQWVVTMVTICLFFLIVALFTGQLGAWLEILYFETFPEHFHGEYSVGQLLGRPPEFYGMLLRYSGFTPIILVFSKGKVARTATALVVCYTALLCFIDHFPSHYFVPPLYLIGVAVTATLMDLKGWKQWSALALCSAGLAYGLHLPL